MKIEINMSEADEKKFIEPFMLNIWIFDEGSISSMSSSYKTREERLEAIKEYIELEEENKK